jgi:hypothetical protein
MANQHVKDEIKKFLLGQDFASSEINLTKSEAKDWVRMRSNPWRFQPMIFIGTWADPNSHPAPGEIRILRIMTGPDQVTRAIARQGKYLYCYPWM